MITGGSMLARRLTAVVRGRLIDAEIVRFETHRLPDAVKRAPRSRGSISRSTVTPYVRYTAGDGSEITAQYDQQVTRRVWKKFPVGAKMQVRIDPARPNVAYDPSAASMFVLPALLLFTGVLMSLFALGIVFGASP